MCVCVDCRLRLIQDIEKLIVAFVKLQKGAAKLAGDSFANASSFRVYIAEPPRRFYWLEASFFGQLLDSIPLRSIYFSES